MPPSYFIYTTGNGFPPIIESVPHALKGIGTAFMLALLTGTCVLPIMQGFMIIQNLFAGRGERFGGHYDEYPKHATPRGLSLPGCGKSQGALPSV